jgi:hypothetical protein
VAGPEDAGALLAAKGAGKDVKIIGTDGLPGPAGGIEAVAKGDWAATFTYPTGAKEAIEMSKKILLDCATSVESTVTVETTAITAENAKQLMGRDGGDWSPPQRLIRQGPRRGLVRFGASWSCEEWLFSTRGDVSPRGERRFCASIPPLSAVRTYIKSGRQRSYGSAPRQSDDSVNRLQYAIGRASP